MMVYCFLVTFLNSAGVIPWTECKLRHRKPRGVQLLLTVSAADALWRPCLPSTPKRLLWVELVLLTPFWAVMNETDVHRIDNPHTPGHQDTTRFWPFCLTKRRWNKKTGRYQTQVAGAVWKYLLVYLHNGRARRTKPGLWFRRVKFQDTLQGW